MKRITCFFLVALLCISLFGCGGNPNPPVTYYSVSYLANAGTDAVSGMPSDQASVAAGTQLDEPSEPNRAGYTFDGWYLQAEGGESVTFPVTINSDLVFHAQWTATAVSNVQLRFVSNTTDTVSSMPIDRSVAVGYVLNKPSPNPIRVGYNFDDWYNQAVGGTKYTFPLTISQDTTLHAQWLSQVAQFNVNYYANGDNVSGIPSNTTVASGTVLNAPADPSRTGYSFSGWFDQPSGGSAIVFPLTVTTNVSIYAQWTASGSYSVSYDKNTTDTVSYMPASASLASGTVIQAPSPLPYRSGYTFAGFFDAPTGGNPVPYPITVNANLVLYAQWIKNTIRAYMKIGDTEYSFAEDIKQVQEHLFISIFDIAEGGMASFYYNSTSALTFNYYIRINPTDTPTIGTSVKSVQVPSGALEVRFDKLTGQPYWNVAINGVTPTKTLPGFTVNNSNPDARTEATEIASPAPETMPKYPSGTATKIKEYRVTTTLTAGDKICFWVGAGGMESLIDGDLGNFGIINSSKAQDITVSGSYTIVFKQFDGQIGKNAVWRITIIKN